VLLPASLDDGLPLLARSGAVLPIGPVIQSADELAAAPLLLEAFPGEDGRAWGRLYEDDGVSTDHRGGGWALTTFELRREDGASWRLEARRRGRFEPGPGEVAVIVHEDGPEGPRARRGIGRRDRDKWAVVVR
jgi:hypothetical protein